MSVLIQPVSLSVVLLTLGGICVAGRAIRMAAACGLASVLLLWVGSTPAFAKFLCSALEHQYPPRPMSQIPNADVAIVLGGGGLGAMASPNNRAWLALELYNARKVGRILVTGRSAAAEARAALIGWGVPDSDVLIEPESTSTSEEADRCKHLMLEAKVNSALLVTSAMHMPRALSAFRSARIEVTPAPTELMINPSSL